jgi:hypothetical protein
VSLKVNRPARLAANVATVPVAERKVELATSVASRPLALKASGQQPGQCQCGQRESYSRGQESAASADSAPHSTGSKRGVLWVLMLWHACTACRRLDSRRLWDVSVVVLLLCHMNRCPARNRMTGRAVRTRPERVKTTECVTAT